MYIYIYIHMHICVYNMHVCTYNLHVIQLISRIIYIYISVYNLHIIQLISRNKCIHVTGVSVITDTARPVRSRHIPWKRCNYRNRNYICIKLNYRNRNHTLQLHGTELQVSITGTGMMHYNYMILNYMSSNYRFLSQLTV